jgi:hypothetical protein
MVVIFYQYAMIMIECSAGPTNYSKKQIYFAS